MTWHLDSPIFPLFVIAATMSALAVYIFREHQTSESRILAVLSASVAVWCFAYALELGCAGLPNKLLWARVKYLGIAVIPTAWLLFALHYSGKKHWLKRGVVSLLASGPPAILAVVWTNDFHSLFWTGISVERTRGFSVLALPTGAGFWLCAGYNHLLVLLGTVLILESFLRSHRLFRKQAGIILLGALVPWVGNAIFIFGLSPVSHLDLTPFAFAVTCLSCAWSLFRLHITELVPIAYDAVIQGMDDCVIVLDGRNRIIEFNLPARPLFACVPSEAIGEPAEHVLPDLAAQLRLPLDENAATSREVMLDDGTARRVYDVRISCLRDRQSRSVGKVVVLRDITLRKQAEENLEGSLSLLRATLESTADGILVVHNEGRAVGCNRKFLKMWGLSEAEAMSGDKVLEGRLFLEQLKEPEEYLTRLKALYAEAEAEGCELLELNDGRIYERYTQPRRIGETIVGRVFSFRDITENTRLQNQLVETTTYLENLLETASDVIYTLDLRSSLTFINRRAEEVTGYTRRELMENGIAFLVHEDDRTEHARRFKIVLNGGCEASQIRFRRKDGKVITLSVNETRIVSEGRPVGIFGIARDITNELALEEQLRQAQKLEAVEQLAGGIAHDFNNLLTVIVGHTQLAMMETEDADPIRDDLQEVESAAQMAADLVNQLLAFSRRQTTELRLVNLNSILDEMRTVLRSLVKKDTSLRLRPASGLWPVKVDPNQFKQVVFNLVINAGDATPPGGAITLRAENVNVGPEEGRKIGDLKPGRYVVLTVTDTGKGMSKEIQCRIFEPFFTTKPEGKGTGLGLSTVHGIIKRHGGHIAVCSEAGCGTSFTISLPAGDGSPEYEELVGAIQAGHGLRSVLPPEDEKSRRRTQTRTER